MDPNDLEQLMKIAIQGKCLSKAIIEDYSEVMSKLTNTPIDEIKLRILKRAEAIRIKEQSGL